jgi:hypothetical protein
MITAKQALQTLQDAGLLSKWSVKRMKADRDEYFGFPAYTSVTGSGQISIGEETYGKRSFLYVNGKDTAALRKAQKVIRKMGGKIEAWCVDPKFSFQISPIKGWHWWE